jgi:antitoxin component of MazEF toxin-antitoxin module
MPQLLDVSHVSKRGASLRCTLPKTLRKILNITDDKCTLGFYEMDGRIVIQKMK